MLKILRDARPAPPNLPWARNTRQNSYSAPHPLQYSRRGFPSMNPRLLDGSLGKRSSWTSLISVRLPHRDARSLRVHPGSNVHGGQLLEKQLGRVGDVHLRDLGFVLARPAFERGLFEVPRANEHQEINRWGGIEAGLTPRESSAHRYRRYAL